MVQKWSQIKTFPLEGMSPESLPTCIVFRVHALAWNHTFLHGRYHACTPVNVWLYNAQSYIFVAY